MARLLDILENVNRGIARCCLWLSAVGLVAMTAIIGWQVFGRYVLNDSPQWSEVLCLFLMTYYILFAAAAGVHDKFHIGLTFTRLWLSPKGARVCDGIIYLIVGLFGLGMVWFGAQMAATTWTHVIPTLNISVGVSYLPFPLAGLLFILFSLEHILNAIFDKEARPSWN